jgi:hypothetical protein
MILPEHDDENSFDEYYMDGDTFLLSYAESEEEFYSKHPLMFDDDLIEGRKGVIRVIEDDFESQEDRVEYDDDGEEIEKYNSEEDYYEEEGYLPGKEEIDDWDEDIFKVA